MCSHTTNLRKKAPLPKFVSSGKFAAIPSHYYDSQLVETWRILGIRRQYHIAFLQGLQSRWSGEFGKISEMRRKHIWACRAFFLLRGRE